GSFLLSTFPCFLKLFSFPHSPHTFTTTTGSSFKHYGVTKFFGKFLSMLKRVKKSVRTRYTWNACSFHGSFCSRFVTHFFNHLRRSTNKLNTVLLANFRELSIL